MTAVQLDRTIHHDPTVTGDDAEGSCQEPRVYLVCSGCAARVVFCHAGASLIRADVRRTYRCAACTAGGRT